MRARAMLAIAALSTGLAVATVPASAQTYGNPPPYPQAGVNPDAYCAQVRQNRMLVGGAVGATLGAVLGNNLGGRGRQGDGTVLGGVVGGATGALIGRNTGQCSRQNQARAAYPQGQYGAYPQGGYQQGAYGGPYPAQPGYGDDRYPLAGGPGYRTSSSTGGDPNCRWGTVSTRDPDGREVRDSIYMCRGPDGVWRANQPY